MTLRSILLGSLLFLPVSSWALDSITIQNKQGTIVTGEPFEISVVFHFLDQVPGNIDLSIKDVPGIHDLQILNEHHSKSQSLQIINGVQSASGRSIIRYRLVTDTPQKITLGPITYPSGNKLLESNQIDLDIRDFRDTYQQPSMTKSKEARFWIGIFVGIGIVATIIGAIVRIDGRDDHPAISHLSYDETKRKIRESTTLDHLYGILQNTLCYLHDETFRTKTSQEIRNTIDDRNLHALLEHFSRSRYNQSTSEDLDRAKDMFIAFLRDHE